MKVYVLTEGEYSDYHIEAVKIDRAEAEKLLKVHPGWEIEEYDTEEITIKEKYIYEVYESGTIWEQESVKWVEIVLNKPEQLDYGKREWMVYVEAQDIEHALKKGSDLIAKAKMESIDNEEAEDYYIGNTISTSTTFARWEE